MYVIEWNATFGSELYGPFETADAAAKYAVEHFKPLTYLWKIKMLRPPTDD